ncbi:VOC family protein [Metabacillus sp. 84]|uniref:VOC family protein n=1 Tax=Metabacillus sp. 84 TaxID=3404705 RepID=UPI003CECD88A
MIFHYHYWTPNLEKTERFYSQLGFTVRQRIGKKDGTFHSYNPPLTWDDFRKEQPLFRIIEMKKGQVNVTIGFGKNVIFDHIGFLVTKDQHDTVCKKARELGWKPDEAERRTFIPTPYGFRLELQTHSDVLDTGEPAIEEIRLGVLKAGLEKDLVYLFGRNLSVKTELEEIPSLKEVKLSNIASGTDPNGVLISGTALG